jgi:hypothetical protein
MSISSITGSILVLTLWGFGGGIGLPVFAPFAIAFGLAAGGFSSMWSQSAHAIAGPDKEKQTMLISGQYRVFAREEASNSFLSETQSYRMVHRSGAWSGRRSYAGISVIPSSVQFDFMGIGRVSRSSRSGRRESGLQRSYRNPLRERSAGA